MTTNTHPTDETAPLLLGITASILFGLGIMLFDNPTNQSVQLHEPSVSIPLAPVVTGRSAAQLERELARVNEEVEQVQAEREAMLKAIEEVTDALNKKLKEANLETLSPGEPE